MFMINDGVPSRDPFCLERKHMVSMWSDSSRWEDGSMEAVMTNDDD